MTLNCAPPVGADPLQWQAHADQWYPELSAERTAKVLCHGCSGKDACLALALLEDRPGHAHGIRGGLTPSERAKLLGRAR